MKPNRAITGLLICWAFMNHIGMTAFHGSNSYAQTFHAGKWDSTLYNYSDHPRTVFLRVQVEDTQTRIPLSGVLVLLQGEYDDYAGFGRPQRRPYSMRAITGHDGIAVFSLLWQDRGYASLDDIQMVTHLSARKEGYQFAIHPVDFSPMIRDSAAYDPEGWKHIIMNTPGARYFLPQFDVRFADYNNERSKSPEIFELVRRERYGEVFPARDLTGADFPAYFTTFNPQREAGPYMVLPIMIEMERLFQEHRILPSRTRPRTRGR